MKSEKMWWTVWTDCGVRRTLAVSRAKAIRNVRYRLVMDDRAYERPGPGDLAEMRDIEVFDAVADEETTDGASGGPEPCPRRFFQ